MSRTQDSDGQENFSAETSHENTQPYYASRSFADRLYAYKPTMRREEEEMQERIDARQLDLQLSKKLTKNWLDTQENIIRSSNAEKKRKKKLYDLEGKKILQEVETASEVASKKVIEDAMRKKFAEQCNVKRLHSAFILTEVLNEQRAQLEFKEKIREMRRRKDTEFMENLNEDIRMHMRDIEREKENKIKLKLKYRKELEKQLAEQEREKVAEEMENVIITENFFEKLPRINTANSKEIKDKMQHLGQTLKEDFSQRGFLSQEREKDEKLDDQHVKIFHDAEEKISNALKEKIKKAFETSQEERLKVQSETALLYDRLEKAREMEEKAIIEKRRMETKAREESIKKANRYKYKHDIAEFLSVNDMLLERNRNRMEELVETKRLLAQHRTKLSDHDKKYKEIKENQMRYMQTCTRTFYKEQNDSNDTIQKKEKRRDKKCFQQVIQSHECEDDDFKEYAKALIEHCKSKGRDARPMEKMLKEIYSTKLRK